MQFVSKLLFIIAFEVEQTHTHTHMTEILRSFMQKQDFDVKTTLLLTCKVPKHSHILVHKKVEYCKIFCRNLIKKTFSCFILITVKVKNFRSNFYQKNISFLPKSFFNMIYLVKHDFWLLLHCHCHTALHFTTII